MNRIPRSRPRNMIPQQNIKLTKKDSECLAQGINIPQVQMNSNNISSGFNNNKNSNLNPTKKSSKLSDSSHRTFGVDISNQIKNNASTSVNISNQVNSNMNSNHAKKSLSNLNEKVRIKFIYFFLY